MMCHSHGVTKSETFENILHQAPLRESGLDQVDPNECRKPQPVRVYPVSKCQANQDERSSDQTDGVLQFHFGSPTDGEVHFVTTLVLIQIRHVGYGTLFRCCQNRRRKARTVAQTAGEAGNQAIFQRPLEITSCPPSDERSKRVAYSAAETEAGADFCNRFMNCGSVHVETTASAVRFNFEGECHEYGSTGDVCGFHH